MTAVMVTEICGELNIEIIPRSVRRWPGQTCDVRLSAQANVRVAQQRQGIATLLFQRLLPLFAARRSAAAGRP